MDCMFSNPNKRASDYEVLLGFQQAFTWFDEDTFGDNNNVVVRGIGICKLVLHSV